MNPVLYANPWAMNDVLTGANYGCGQPAFNVTEGWDPVTGLGTPDFERLLKIYQQLP
jgi:tripeptidyl-peptidase I